MHVLCSGLSARRLICGISILIVLAGTPHKVMGYPDLTSAFSALGFDPHAEGNALVVLLSDAHMNVDFNVRPVSTNLDPRFVEIVNGISPSPEKIIVLGDVSTSLSPIPGWVSRDWSYRYATNEMQHWNNAITALTNVALTNILWIPGNHDQLASEANSETFQMMFPSMPPYQHLDVGGTRFVLLNTGNYGYIADEQVDWLERVAEATPVEMPLAVMTHIPPFHPTMNVYFRGVGRVLRETFGSREGTWRVFSGHFHDLSATTFKVGNSTAFSQLIGTSNPKAYNGNSYSSGFSFLCLSNGIAGVIYYRYNTAEFEILPEPVWDRPVSYVAAFETVEGLLWRRLKAADEAPEVIAYTGEDALDWFAYLTELELELVLEHHSNVATDILLLALPLERSTIVELSDDRQLWRQVPTPAEHSNFVFHIPIPEDMQSLPRLYLRVLSGGAGNTVGGWGLADATKTSSMTYPQILPLSDRLVTASVPVSIPVEVRNPYSPPDKMRFELVKGPPGAEVDPDTGLFTWTAPTLSEEKSWEVTIGVRDTGTPLMKAEASFVLTVTEPVLEFASGRLETDSWVMQLRTTPGAEVVVLKSADLVHWEPWFTNNSPNGVLEIHDQIDFGCRFYKAVIGP